MPDPNPNIQAFDRACAAILSDLYDHFPRPKLLDCSTLPIGWADIAAIQASIAACANSPQLLEAARADHKAATELNRELLSTAVATVQFLVDEGFIRIHERSGHRFSSVQLTSQGLGALRKTPDTLRTDTPSMAQRIKDTLTTGEAVGGLITMLLGVVR